MASRLLAFLLAAFGIGLVGSESDAPFEDREAALRALQEGRYRDAFEIFEVLALDPETEPKQVDSDLLMAVQCLRNLARHPEIDDLLARTVDQHGENWRLLRSAAQALSQSEHYGYVIGGEFERGQHRGGGEVVHVFARDRALSLRWLNRGRELLEKSDASGSERFDFYRDLAGHLNTNQGEAWRLQALTDFEDLPDPEPGWNGWTGIVGAPVDAEGNPVTWGVPDSWSAASDDGERWRWSLEQARRADPARGDEIEWQLVNFARSLFGVDTLARGPWHSRNGEDEDTGTFALSTLEDDETIARLATGVRRFELPEGYDHLKRLRALTKKPTQATQAWTTLAEVYENRRRYPRAVVAWKNAIELAPGWTHLRDRLDRIVGNWGRFEPTQTQAAGAGAELEYRYRNGESVTFTAYPVNVERLLEDTQNYLKAQSENLDWQKIRVEDIGQRLMHDPKERARYVESDAVATWSLDLDPLPRHFDRSITITTPLENGGAYWVTARLADGNESHVVVWVSDLAIVQKSLHGENLYFIADARTGAPAPGTHLELFGYRWRRVGKRQVLETEHFAEHADGDGQLRTGESDLPSGYQWLVTARQGDRFAHLGFRGIWYPNHQWDVYDQIKTFGITDRPVYRPDQTVSYKFWVRRARFDDAGPRVKEGQTVSVRLHDPQGNVIHEATVAADRWGGVSGEVVLESEALLGIYSLQIPGFGGTTFRVEEYKKPEFEVTVEAPTEPVQLGESFAAQIQAKYYFGEPVREGKVHYRVLRTARERSWYPPHRWDWLYGPGYWWVASDAVWYPGWSSWGCRGPIGWWWGWQPDPPEVVAEGEAALGSDGTLAVEIDTRLAQELHGDQDHRYEITAEVVDASRRTIVGRGAIDVTREPFRVVTWLDRGWLRVGDSARAHVAASSIAGEALDLSGSLKLFRISYDEHAKPIETLVESWAVQTGQPGRTIQALTLATPGQYRLVAELLDARERTVSGGTLFTVIGSNPDGADFHFDDLEIVPDLATYAPGQTARLQVNTDRIGSTVLFFLRPSNGAYLPPQLIRMTGKTTEIEVPVELRDMPNFFVEAVTVSDGRVHSVVKSILVPPEQRVLEVAVEPESNVHEPGESDRITLRLTDANGEPFVGTTVLSVYDKAVEYISGGSNVPEIRAFFWKWLRQHSPRGDSNLGRWSSWLATPGEPTWQAIGLFGHELMDDTNALGAGDTGWVGRSRSSRRDLQALGYSGSPSAETASREGSFADSSEGGDSALSELVEPTVRSDFRDTAFWAASLETDSTGRVEVTVPLPDSLTTWKVSAWAMGDGTRVGSGTAEIITRKDVLVRLQAPRFFVEKDEVVLSANVHNYLDEAKDVQVTFDLLGDVLAPMGAKERTVHLDPRGEARVDLRVRVDREGEALVRVSARTDRASDAMELRFPAYVHGALRTESWAGSVRPGDDAQTVEVRIPSERRPDQSELVVRFSPTLAGALVDALPYLADYPYGCTEQTLNRFVPTVITQRTLQRLGVDLAAIRDKRANLNAQELGDPAERARQWQRFARNPVFDESEVTRMVKKGVRRLTDMQLSDGGWGWFSGRGERSYPHTTATVVRGLLVAQENDVALVSGMVDRGVAWLTAYENQQVLRLGLAVKKQGDWKRQADALDALVHCVLVRAGVTNARMQDLLYRDRTKIPVYALALFGQALERVERTDRLESVLAMIDQFVIEDAENETAYLQLNSPWWTWYGSEIEAHATYLSLLSRVAPDGKRAAWLAKYLINNRKHATYWNSTRDTALCIEALADFLLASGEAKPDMTVDVVFDGTVVRTVDIDPGNVFAIDNTVRLTGDALTDGEHQIELRRRGTGTLYFNVYLTNFNQEDPIPAAGLEVKVERRLYRLIPEEDTTQVAGQRGQVIDQKVEKMRREPIDGDTVLTSGELVEVELLITSKNDYEYLIFEDFKPAGCEPVDLQSGYRRDGMGAYVQYRDEGAVFFVRLLARGRHSVKYRLRAEIPGRFSALPTQAAAMYAPELRGNSSEAKLTIIDG